MQNSRLTFTELAVRTLKEGTYWDNNLKAFGLRVGKRTRTFFCVRDCGNRITIGRYPVLTLQEARREAKKLLAADPTPEPESPSLTFLETYESYLNTRILPNYRPQPARELQRIIKAHCTHLDNKALRDISHTDISDIMTKMQATPRQANYLFGVLRTMFNWAEKRDLCTNPLRKISKPFKEQSRDRVLSDEELAKIWRACELRPISEPKGEFHKEANSPQAISLPANFATIVKLLILTGQRKSEIANLHASWIHEDTITLPWTITKNRLDHTLPITSLPLSILREKITPPPNERLNDYLLFPARGKQTPFNGWSKSKAKLNKLSGVNNWTLHDLRRTFSTIHARIDTPPHVSEALLNHQSGTRTPIQRIYDRHTYLPQMRTAMENYEREIRRIIKNV